MARWGIVDGPETSESQRLVNYLAVKWKFASHTIKSTIIVLEAEVVARFKSSGKLFGLQVFNGFSFKNFFYGSQFKIQGKPCKNSLKTLLP